MHFLTAFEDGANGCFLAVQQNINNGTEGERNSEKTVDFTKTGRYHDWGQQTETFELSRKANVQTAKVRNFSVAAVSLELKAVFIRAH